MNATRRRRRIRQRIADIKKLNKNVTDQVLYRILRRDMADATYSDVLLHQAIATKEN